jgi:phosphatidate cytidylyltransferase
MIQTRICIGTLLAVAAAGILIADQWLAPWFPCLLICLALMGLVATRELVGLFPAEYRPNPGAAVIGVFVILASNFALPSADSGSRLSVVLIAFVGAFLAALMGEMYRYRQPGPGVVRLALTLFAFTYLGLLGSFLAQLRWLGDVHRTSTMLALTIFVPKAGDVGAFFTGTYLGRHKMTPILSPKKTWEGFAGGMITAMLAAIMLSYTGDVFRYGILEAAAFGLVIGIVGVLGDLAESLIKRDCQTKDAANSIPGFGGLLDVIDSVLFAAPVAYLWFRE